MIFTLFFVGRSNAAEQLQVTVFTGNQTYDAGQLVTISGQVLDENQEGVPFAAISIQANDPGGNPIHVTRVFSSADGTYDDQFTTPLYPVNGGYTIYVMASKPGFTDGSSQAVCTITPEFPITHVQWLMLLPIILVALLARRRTSSESKLICNFLDGIHLLSTVELGVIYSPRFLRCSLRRFSSSLGIVTRTLPQVTKE